MGWPPARGARARGCQSSRPYTLLHDPTGAAVGFARVVTDGSWFAWIGDVLVLAEHRGGRGQFLMRCVMEDLEPVRRVSLGTRDAHGPLRAVRLQIRTGVWGPIDGTDRRRGGDVTGSVLRRLSPFAATEHRTGNTAQALFVTRARDLFDQHAVHLLLLMRRMPSGLTAQRSGREGCLSPGNRFDCRSIADSSSFSSSCSSMCTTPFRRVQRYTTYGGYELRRIRFTRTSRMSHMRSAGTYGRPRGAGGVVGREELLDP